MAALGAKYIRFAPFETEVEGSLPNYKEAVSVGALVKAELTVNLAAGEIYGDDRLDEKIEEFVSGSLAVETTDLTDETEAVIFGSTLTEKELVDNTGDSIPYGGLGYIKTVIRGGVKKFKAYYYPKAASAKELLCSVPGCSCKETGAAIWCRSKT